MKVRDKHDTASSMGAHEYKNIELVEIDGILRVRKKSTKEGNANEFRAKR